ncbi:hypothetical protein DTO96_100953 [Ephemeroptericola cinctiostellae]|uniref:Acid shock protein n=1 Tax=Ephemeroptericola cinctiostellae TaxID=2268024 RepID=A0A345DA39_9BURK|nr:hypothetical protein [Ephemeroptericola cinctiostellae]AXF85227.1 hypothetical protein DTO96_100953 [Ephemeroptericola cinctiostellae]
MKKTLATLMFLAFGLGASTSFAQNAEPAHVPNPAAHSMKMDAPQTHQMAPAPHAPGMQLEPHHKPVMKKHRKPKNHMHKPM